MSNFWQADFQLLSEILEIGMPPQESQRAARKLLKYFGSLKLAAAASKEHLVRIGDLTIGAAESIIQIRRLAIALIRNQIQAKTLLRNKQCIIKYCRALLAGEKNEQFWAIYLDKAGYLITDELIQCGTIDHVTIYPRELIRRALEHFACGIILVHNHPSGNVTPSQTDISMTKILTAATRLFGIKIIDHIIIGKESEASFHKLGYLLPITSDSRLLQQGRG